MGLAASQVRLLTLTSDKLSLEKQIMINTNRKMVLTNEMSRLAYEKNSRLNQFEYQVSTLDGGMQEISYKYLMGKEGGVQDITTKSEQKMMLFESSTGKVVLTKAMADKIGPYERLRTNQNEKFAAISRLCGTTNVVTPQNAPSYLNFCIDPELIKRICQGEYDIFDDTKLTMAIDKYYLQSYFVNGDVKNDDELFEAFQIYRAALDTVGGGVGNTAQSGIFNSLHSQENIATATIAGTTLGNNTYTWAQAINVSPYNNAYNMGNKIVFFPNIQGEAGDYTAKVDMSGVPVNMQNAFVQRAAEAFLNPIVVGLAQNYSDLTGYSMSKFERAINQTVEEFVSNTNFDIMQGDSVASNIFVTTRNTDSTLDRYHLKVYMAASEAGENQYILGFDASALVSYFYAAIMGEGIGYNSSIGMDSYVKAQNWKTNVVLSDAYTNVDTGYSNYAFTPNMNGDKHLFQHVVPTGQSLDDWNDSFQALINDVKFYYPIVEACAKFGYTTGYDGFIDDSSYVDESLQNGTFQIMDFDPEKCNLEGSHNTKYYLMFGDILKTAKAENEVAVQAWYKRERNAIKCKEEAMDSMIEQMDTELNSINTEIESIKSLIKDSSELFEWGNA